MDQSKNWPENIVPHSHVVHMCAMNGCACAWA